MTKREQAIISSRVYRKLYREELGKLFKKASEWLEKRNIVEYDVKSGNGFKYFVMSGIDPHFDRSVKNSRVRPTDERTYVSVIKQYCDGSGYEYSAQAAIRFSLCNTDYIFEAAHQILKERNWNDYDEIEYFGYDPALYR